MSKPKASLAPAAVEARERILRAFSERATRSGIRSVVMAELAAELHMSPNTLYNHFASKKELVAATVELWAREVGASEAAAAEIANASSPVEGMVHWAEAWSVSVARYAPAFWDDLRRGYPDIFEVFRRALGRWKELGAAQLRPHLRPNLHSEVALRVLDGILNQVSDPRFSESLGVARRESIRTAIEIWARGALEPPGRLASIASGSRASRAATRRGK